MRDKPVGLEGGRNGFGLGDLVDLDFHVYARDGKAGRCME